MTLCSASKVSAALYFQGFLYSEAGLARRAWQTWRQAIISAQILGLHKERRTLEADKSWWMLYNLDRFFSLMLGMPYAIADVHCNMDYRGESGDDVMTCSGFVIRLSKVTGLSCCGRHFIFLLRPAAGEHLCLE
jgi:hypothetical protein